ncbi:MAG: signal peptidase I [Tissierellia bacterium]|nr:signal peptidase I [Tissierellia bacterium]
MNKLSKLKNILYYLFIFICVFSIFSSFRGSSHKLPIGFWYVYSGSMEPTIKTNDGFILIKAKEYAINDIITFTPKVLKDKYVTHRIIEVTDNGEFVTKGDYNQSTDQEGGEPLINKDQILGKVLTLNGKPIIIPYLGIASEKFNEIIAGRSIFTLIAVGIIIYLFGYIIESFFNKHKGSRKKSLRLLDIAPYFDPVFFALCILMFINIVFIGLTIKTWGPEETSYVVVGWEGLPSPKPGERFEETLSLENLTFIPFVTILEPERQTTEVNPKKLSLPTKENQEYTLSIVAPDKIGYYREKINKRTYPDVLPDDLLDNLYSKSESLPLLLIFGPGIILNIILYIWWLRRWQVGRRKVMEWLIPLRRLLKSFT